MPQIEVGSDDPRLEPYRHLRTRNLTRFSQRFIAESRLLVERLLRSDYGVESVLMDRDYAEESREWIPDSVTTLMLAKQDIEELVGFHFHRGFMACGIRKPDVDWQAVLASKPASDWVGMFAIGIQDPENLGVILRSCAALGIEDCFIARNSADPLSRRVLRVSMGTALKLRLIPVADTTTFLKDLHNLQVQTVAASLQEPAVELGSFVTQGPTMVLLGNEAFGLPEEVQTEADHRLKIAMELGVDSLNVSVAAGIILHYIRRLATARHFEPASTVSTSRKPV